MSVRPNQYHYERMFILAALFIVCKNYITSPSFAGLNWNNKLDCLVFADDAILSAGSKSDLLQKLDCYAAGVTVLK